MGRQTEIPESTRDTLWGGELVFWQPARGAGYRFNLDPVLLAGFVRPGGHVLDLGAGCGILGVLLLASGRAQRVTGVEIQEQLVEFATRNAQENGLSDRLRTLNGDLRYSALPAVDAVVFNPPYFRVGEGRAAPDPGRETARRERHGTLEDFVRQGLSCLSEAGALYCIVRTDREEELTQLLRRHDASVRRAREVRSRSEATARHVLVEAAKGAVGRVERLPALVVHDGEKYSAEVQALLHQ